MKIYRMQQGGQEWLAIRAGIVTASEMDAIITPELKARTGQGVDTYLAKKLAERWTGAPLPSLGGSGAMEQGSLKEDEAIPALEFETDQAIDRVGFCKTDDGKIGCSPDGLFGSILDDGEGHWTSEGGVECKCPEAHTHVGYLLANALPKDYVIQVHASMLVTDAQWWKFYSYARGFPRLLLTIQRDDKVIAAIRAATDAFNARLDAAFERLVTINGGPPERKPPESIFGPPTDRPKGRDDSHAGDSLPVGGPDFSKADYARTL